MKVTHKELQQAATEINTIFELSPKIKIISVRPVLEKEIRENLSGFVSAGDSRIDQLSRDTLKVYDSVAKDNYGAVSEVAKEMEEETATVPAGEGEEECPVFSKEYDPSAPECAECARATECSALMAKATKAEEKKPKAFREGTSAKAILGIIADSPDGMTKDEVTAKFTSMVESGGMKSSNPAGRVYTILSGAVREGKVIKEGNTYKAV